MNSGRFASKPDNSNRGPVVKHYSLRRSPRRVDEPIGGIEFVERKVLEAEAVIAPGTHPSPHFAPRASRQSNRQRAAPPTGGSQLATQDGATRQDQASSQTARPPPTIAFSSKYRARPRPDRMDRVASKRLVGEHGERRAARPALQVHPGSCGYTGAYASAGECREIARKRSSASAGGGMPAAAECAGDERPRAITNHEANRRLRQRTGPARFEQRIRRLPRCPAGNRPACHRDRRR